MYAYDVQITSKITDCFVGKLSSDFDYGTMYLPNLVIITFSENKYRSKICK